MNQETFNKAFTKKAFNQFLASMTEAEIKECQVHSQECFFGMFARSLFPNDEMSVYWGEAVSYKNDKPIHLKYPEWAQNYLEFLKESSDVNHERFTRLMRTASIQFLNE